MDLPGLFDETHALGFRRRYRLELVRSTRLDVAVTRLRLSTIDLTEQELSRIERVRLVLAELHAVALDAEAHALMARRSARAQLLRLERLLNQDRVRIRVAPLAGWSPDFSVFSDERGPRSVLVGFHAFEVPHPYAGPALGAHFGKPEATVASRRFEEVWARGHDVAPAIRTIFQRAGRWSRHPDRGWGPRNPVDTLPALG
jgi:hypothetical protein